MAKEIGISESCLRNWLAQAESDDGKREGLTSSERKELAELRRENRVLRMERDVLSRRGRPCPAGWCNSTSRA